MLNKIKKFINFINYKWFKGYCRHICYKCEYKCEKEYCKTDSELWFEQLKNI